MLTLDSCLCFKLETGGLIIGWFTVISNILSIIFGFIGIILLCIYDCHDLEKLAAMFDIDSTNCSVLRGVLIVAYTTAIALGLGFTFIGYMCIKGTKTRDHFRVKPLMILLAIIAVLSILQVFCLTVNTIVNGLIGAVVYGYFFVVMYSLYIKLKKEYESSGINKQFEQPLKV